MTTLGRALAAPVLARDRLRPDIGPVVLVALLVAVSAFLGASLPRLLEASADAGLRATVAAAAPASRNLVFERAGSIAAGPSDPLAGVVAEGDGLRDELGPRVGTLTGTPSIVADSIEHRVLGAPLSTTQVRLRIQPDAGPLVAWAAGRPPTSAVRRTTLDRVDPDGIPFEALVYEAAVATETAEALGLRVGDRYEVQPQPDESYVAGVGRANLGYAVIEIVGRFDVRDPADPAWFSDPSLREASVEVLGFETYVYHATLLVDPGAYGALIGPQPGSAAADPYFPVRYRWRFAVDAGALDGGSVAALLTDLARLRADHPPIVAGLGDASTLSTSLDRVVAGYAAQRSTTEAAMAVAAIGPAVAGAGLIALVAILVARRRATATAVVRSRGASTLQVLGSRLVEAVIVATVAASLGLLAALALVPARSPATGFGVAVAVAAVSVALLVAAAWRDARSGARTATVERLSLRPTTRRIVLDGFVVALALAACGALLGRGLRPGEAGETDPLLAAAPVLLAAAGALLAVRLLPFPVALVAALASRRRDLVPVLAGRLASRSPAGTSIPLFVVIVATAVAVFSSIALASVEDGQVRSTWEEVGADVRLDVPGGGGVPTPILGADVSGVRAVAEARSQAITLRGAGIRPTRGSVLAIDVGAYRAVVAGTPLDGALPSVLVAPVAGSPIPLLLAPEMLQRAGVAPGSIVEMEGFTADVRFIVAGTVTQIPGLGVTDRTMVAPLEAIRAAAPGRALLPNHLLVAADPGAETSVAEAYHALAADYGSLLRVESRGTLVRELAESPLARSLSAGFALAAAIALAYAVLALVAGIVLAAGMRSGQLAILRTLGVSRRGLGGLILLEQLPLVAVALVAGVALGVAMVVVLMPALGLDVFTGARGAGLGIDLAPVQVTPVVDPVRTATFAILPMVAVIVVVAASAWVVGRRNLARTVRAGES